MKSYLVRPSDVNNFTECPLIYTKGFKEEPGVVYSSLYRVVDRILKKMFLFGEIPSLSSIKTYWGKEMELLIEEGVEKEILNDATMSIVKFYEDFYSRIKSNKLFSVGYNSKIDYVTEKAIFESHFPAILANKNKDLIPIFITDKLKLIKRDNGIRFSLAVLNNETELNLHKYWIIRIFPRVINITVEEFSLYQGEIVYNKDQMDQILRAMSSGYSVANTFHCDKCKFTHKCRMY